MSAPNRPISYCAAKVSSAATVIAYYLAFQSADHFLAELILNRAVFAFTARSRPAPAESPYETWFSVPFLLPQRACGGLEPSDKRQENGSYEAGDRFPTPAVNDERRFTHGKLA